MYSLFKMDWRTEKENENYPSIKYYKTVFGTMGLKFKPLKSDTCKTCDMLELRIKCADDSSKENLQKVQLSHHEEAEYLQTLMKNDFDQSSKTETIQAVAFDLQKILPLPKSPTNILFYMRNLTMFNLGVHDGSTGNGYFHTWLETEAGRGPQEIASSVLKFLQTNLKKTAETLILWCDSCSGQNRNFILTAMLHHFLSTQLTLKTILIRFLVSGHSYMSCDRDFACVEKAVRKTEKIFLPSEYIKIMKDCNKKNPFHVTEMTTEDFLSAKPILNMINESKTLIITKK